jgi:hypothetical protein
MTGKFQRPRVQDKKYLADHDIRVCAFTGQRGNDSEAVVAMHVGTYGKGIKSDDEVIFVLNRFHAHGHQTSEIRMIRENAPDWLLREAFKAWAREQYKDWKNS